MPQSKRKVTSADELSSTDEIVAPAKKSKTEKRVKNTTKEVQKDDDGNSYWELTGKRRITISEFKGTTMIGIREYYEKDGKDLPGKKGISLPLDQFSAVIGLLPQIEGALKAKGEKIPRPDYAGGETMDDLDEAAEKKGKENYEETSDED